MNLKLWFPCKPVDVQVGTIPENAHIGDYYQFAKYFYAWVKTNFEILSYDAGQVVQPQEELPITPLMGLYMV